MRALPALCACTTHTHKPSIAWFCREFLFIQSSCCVECASPSLQTTGVMNVGCFYIRVVHTHAPHSAVSTPTAAAPTTSAPTLLVSVHVGEAAAAPKNVVHPLLCHNVSQICMKRSATATQTRPCAAHASCDPSTPPPARRLSATKDLVKPKRPANVAHGAPWRPALVCLRYAGQL